MAIDVDNYKLFTSSEYQSVIGDDLSEKLFEANINNNPSVFILYVSQTISNCIEKYTSLKLYKTTSTSLTGEYSASLGLKKYKDEDNKTVIVYETKLTDEQIEAIKLACIYQADYIMDTGSTERMSAIGLVNRSNKYNKADLEEFAICDLAFDKLSRAGLLYQGIGGGVYARIK